MCRRVVEIGSCRLSVYGERRARLVQEAAPVRRRLMAAKSITLSASGERSLLWLARLFISQTNLVNLIGADAVGSVRVRLVAAPSIQSAVIKNIVRFVV